MSMTITHFMESTDICPVIPAIKGEEWIEPAKQSESDIVYVLYGDICNIVDIVDELKKANKKVIVHIDLIVGFSAKEICVDFIKKYTKADGIISMKPALIKRANEIGLFTIQRFFMMDIMTYRNIEKHVKASNPDIVEFMPAGLTKVIHYLMEGIEKPIVASGLILDKDDIMGALKTGALAVSTTKIELWDC